MGIKELSSSEKVKVLIRNGKINRLLLKMLYGKVKNVIFKENSETYQYVLFQIKSAYLITYLMLLKFN